MKDSERTQNEIITILLLILTLTFTSSNLTLESADDNFLAEILPISKVIN
jgi:hypothetical protein